MAFNNVFHNIFINKMVKYELDKVTAKCIKNWLNSQAHSVVKCMMWYNVQLEASYLASRVMHPFLGSFFQYKKFSLKSFYLVGYFLFSLYVWTHEQVVQGHCGISVLSDTQNPTGNGPEHPAVGSPALSKGLDKVLHRDAFSNSGSVIPWHGSTMP